MYKCIILLRFIFWILICSENLVFFVFYYIVNCFATIIKKEEADYFILKYESRNVFQLSELNKIKSHY